MNTADAPDPDLNQRLRTLEQGTQRLHGLVVLLVLVAITLLAVTIGPWLSAHEADGFDMAGAFQPPSARHWLPR